MKHLKKFQSLTLYVSQDEANLPSLRQLSSSNPTLSNSLQSIPPTPPYLTPQKDPSNNSLRPQSYTESTTTTSLPNHVINSEMSDDFSILAAEVFSQLSEIHRSLVTERDRMKQVQSDGELGPLRNRLTQVIHQNADMRARLARIHADSDLSNVGSPIATLTNAGTLKTASLRPSISFESSSCFSASEYFDAAEGSMSDSSSDVSDTSEASDTVTEALTQVNEAEVQIDKCTTGRRTQLSVPAPNKEDFSLFNFLYKNIGKDLSKVSMPVTLNEPLNMLQRLCEELEYSELLDKAATLEDPGERMVQVASFAISAYAASVHRVGHKPFNPLLGETYECIREDKGFRFISEQVSHHPPISAAHAIGNNFTLWEDVRIKTKFWGKSLEFQPSGTVHLTLRDLGDTYEWNKVTSCVHNLFGGGERWVDQYGECVITNKAHGITCKLTFMKANSWSGRRHEVFGSITEGLFEYIYII